MIRDRDGKLPALFDTVLADAGTEIVLSGVRIPRMGSIMERWVQTCRRQLLDRSLILVFGNQASANTSNTDRKYDEMCARRRARLTRVRTESSRVPNTAPVGGPSIGRPLLSLHGRLDTLLPIGAHADAYARLVTDAGSGSAHRLYCIQGSNHVDGYCDVFPNRLRPLQPWYEQTFQALEYWVEQDVELPPSGTIAGDPEPTSRW